MSSAGEREERIPLIALVHNANRVLQGNMAHSARQRGYPQARAAHNAVFATLGRQGARASDMAERAGITKQSMGEVVRELVDVGILEMRTDPSDRRAKLVSYTEEGLKVALAGRAYLHELEGRYEEAFGSEEYAAARKVLLGIVELFDDGASSEGDPSSSAHR